MYKTLFSVLLILLCVGKVFAQDRGFIKIETNLDEFILVIDDDFDHPEYLSSGDSVSVNPGVHEFRIIAERINDKVFSTNIISGKTFAKQINFQISRFGRTNSSYPRYHWDANLIVMAEEGADILVNNELKGTGIQGFKLNRGFYNITVRNNGRKESVRYQSFNRQLDVIELTTLPLKSKAKRLSFIPGASQIYKEQRVKGILFSIGFTGLVASTIHFNRQFHDAEAESERLITAYLDEKNPSDVLAIANSLETSMDNAEKYSNRYNFSLFTLGGIYLLNIADGLLSKPSRGYYKGWSVDPFVDFDTNEERFYGLTLKKEF